MFLHFPKFRGFLLGFVCFVQFVGFERIMCVPPSSLRIISSTRYKIDLVVYREKRGMMTSNQAEEVDVRFEDQEKINEFGRMNNRLLEIRADLTQLKQDIEKLDDAATELAMNATGKVMLFIGESFLHTSEDHATEYCEKKQEALQSKVDSLTREEREIVQRQEILKKELYLRFGDSINLEN